MYKFNKEENTQYINKDQINKKFFINFPLQLLSLLKKVCNKYQAAYQ